MGKRSFDGAEAFLGGCRTWHRQFCSSGYQRNDRLAIQLMNDKALKDWGIIATWVGKNAIWVADGNLHIRERAILHFSNVNFGRLPTYVPTYNP
jgi:hypothetical protein